MERKKNVYLSGVIILAVFLIACFGYLFFKFSFFVKDQRGQDEETDKKSNRSPERIIQDLTAPGSTGSSEPLPDKIIDSLSAPSGKSSPDSPLPSDILKNLTAPSK